MNTNPKNNRMIKDPGAFCTGIFATVVGLIPPHFAIDFILGALALLMFQQAFDKDTP